MANQKLDGIVSHARHHASRINLFIKVAKQQNKL